MSLEEIGEILNVYDEGQPPCDEIQEKLEEKLMQIDSQIAQLSKLRSDIEVLLSGWKNAHSKREDTICPIIQP